MTEYTPPPTPNQPLPPPGGVKPAELLDRFLARLIDGVLLGVVFFILSAIITAIIITGFASGFELYLASVFTSLIFVAGTFAYYVFMETAQGATLGKLVIKLKVVGTDGHSLPTVSQSIKRNIFYAANLAAIVPIVGSLLGGLAALVAVIMIAVTINNDTIKRQGWHDKFASETMVLKVG